MRRPKRNGGTKRHIVWIRRLAGTLAVVGVALLLFLGPGAILSEGEREQPGLMIGLEDEPPTTQDSTETQVGDVGVQGEPSEEAVHEDPTLSFPSAPHGPSVESGADFELSTPRSNEADADSTAISVTSGISPRSERIDLEQIRRRLQSGEGADERGDDTRSEPGWEHEIAVGRRGSLRIGYEPAGGSEARDPLSGTLEAEFVVDLFGKASVSAGYRFLNFRDLEGNQELRDALARAQVQVRF